jgi:hypothetical protein
MRATFFIMVIMAIAGCTGRVKDNTENRLDDEIRERLRYGAKHERNNPSLGSLNPSHRKVNGFILLSKDVENSAAAATLGNRYFQHIFDSLQISETDRIVLDAGMDRTGAAVAMRTNELSVLNRVIFMCDPSADIILHTVHE